MHSILGIECLYEVGVIQLSFAQTGAFCDRLQEIGEDDFQIWLSGRFDDQVQATHVLDHLFFASKNNEDFIHCGREALSCDAVSVAEKPARKIKLQFVAFDSVEEPGGDRNAS